MATSGQKDKNLKTCQYCGAIESPPRDAEVRPEQEYIKYKVYFRCGTKLITEKIGPHFYTDWEDLCPEGMALERPRPKEAQA